MTDPASPPFGDYIVFMDESGDHGLVSIDPEYPIFVLVCVIVEKPAYFGSIVPAIKEFKFRYWGHDTAILHSHEIRKPRGDFAFLLVKEHREAFMEDLEKVMSDISFSLVATVIQKDRLKSRYERPFNPYHIALGLCLERVSNVLNRSGQEGKLIHVIAEARGDREDDELELEFRRVMDGKTRLGYDVTGSHFDLRFVSKKANVEGLQLADLCAHPIGRNVLKPDQPNRAFDIVKQKFASIWFAKPSGGFSVDWGLKVFPS